MTNAPSVRSKFAFRVPSARLAAVVFAATLSWSCSQGQISDSGPAVTQTDEARAAALEPPHEPSPVQAELVADVSIIQSGNIIRLGVLLDIDPEWHIHWQNPGKSGEPTKIEFLLPDGFEPGPLQWPAPVRFAHPDGSTGFGYRDQVLLQTEVRSSNLDPDDDWRLTAEVSWLACARECEPGRSTVELMLPYAISGTRLVNYANVPRFDEWARRIPVAYESPERPFSATIGAGNVISLRWDAAASDVEWFPSARTAATFHPAEPETEDLVTRLAFASPSGEPASVAAIDGVVTYGNEAGERRAAELAVSLVRPAQD